MPPPRETFSMISFVFCCLAILVIVLRNVSLRHPKQIEGDELGNAWKIRELRRFNGRHEAASILLELLEKDGAGAWPPKANHDSWPPALCPYKDIYLELVPLLPTAEPSLDDNVNRERINHFRLLMQKSLKERIDIAKVKEILAAVEAGNEVVLPRDAYNGFYGCVAVCRHAYRWGTIPVVKAAQTEQIVDFPEELDVPWAYLQRNFGVIAESGNNTANVLHNFDERGERIYQINVGISDLIRSSEEVFFRMFYDVEVLAFPIYYEIVRAVISFEQCDKESCVEHLKNVTCGVRHLLRVFYDNLVESRISHSVWLSYVQGFQGWGVGRMVDGEFIKYDGLSGNHVLFFQALDAFLGMDPYLTNENMIRYIPLNQRRLCIVLKEHSFRDRLTEKSESKIKNEVQKIVSLLKVFRAAHRARVMSYLEQPAPERLAMTAGKSVLKDLVGGTNTTEAFQSLDQMLVTRLRETI